MEGQYASAYAGARQTYSQGRARLDAIQAVRALCLIVQAYAYDRVNSSKSMYPRINNRKYQL